MVILYMMENYLIQPPRVFQELSPENFPLDGVDKGGKLFKAQVVFVIPPEKVDLEKTRPELIKHNYSKILLDT